MMSCTHVRARSLVTSPLSGMQALALCKSNDVKIVDEITHLVVYSTTAKEINNDKKTQRFIAS